MRVNPYCLLLAMVLGGAALDAQTAVPPQDVPSVDNTTPAWTLADRWTVDPVGLTLGAIAGAPELQFSRISDVLLAGDGRIVVADGASSQIRIFSRTGEFEQVFGRDGEGPGEFRYLTLVGECSPGGLTAWDPRLHRVTEFTWDGALTTWAPDPGSGMPYLGVSCLGEGVVGVINALPAPPFDKTYRLPTQLTVWFKDGATVLATVPGGDRHFLQSESAGEFGPLLLGRRTEFASNGEGLAVGTQDAGEILVLTADGEGARVIRWPSEQRPVTRADVDALVEARLKAAPPERRPALRTAFADYPFPDRLPAHGRLLFDENDHLWVESADSPANPRNEWQVFGPSGVWLGGVELPSGFRLESVSVDRVAGTWRDEFDVEYVRILNLHRN